MITYKYNKCNFRITRYKHKYEIKIFFKYEWKFKNEISYISWWERLCSISNASWIVWKKLSPDKYIHHKKVYMSLWLYIKDYIFLQEGYLVCFTNICHCDML